MSLKPSLILVIVAGLFLTACGTTKIGRITQDPTRYRNKTVNVNGTVTNSFGALGTGVYQVQDDTGQIYVISSSGVPSKGSQVTVQGKVMNGATVLGRSYGTAIQAGSTKVK